MIFTEGPRGISPFPSGLGVARPRSEPRLLCCLGCLAWSLPGVLPGLTRTREKRQERTPRADPGRTRADASRRGCPGPPDHAASMRSALAQAPGAGFWIPADGRLLRWPGDYRQRSLLVPAFPHTIYVSESSAWRLTVNPLLLTLTSILVPSIRVRYMRRFINNGVGRTAVDHFREAGRTST
jgi:hypothetical protein